NDLVGVLVERGAQVNVRDREGKTPLIVAAGAGNLDTVEILLERGGEVNARTDYGWTAIMEAYFEGHPDVVAWLKGKGASLKGFAKKRSREKDWADFGAFADWPNIK
ncbi:MAG: ankyrin repeat domain-containing protein, partial [Pseudomonadota bacterium]